MSHKNPFQRGNCRTPFRTRHTCTPSQLSNPTVGYLEAAMYWHCQVPGARVVWGFLKENLTRRCPTPRSAADALPIFTDLGAKLTNGESPYSYNCFGVILLLQKRKEKERPRDMGTLRRVWLSGVTDSSVTASASKNYVHLKKWPADQHV